MWPHWEWPYKLKHVGGIQTTVVVQNSCVHSWLVVIHPSRYVLVFSYHVGIDLAPRVPNTSSYTLTLFSHITQVSQQVYGVLLHSRLIHLTLATAYVPTNVCFFTNYWNVSDQEYNLRSTQMFSYFILLLLHLPLGPTILISILNCIHAPAVYCYLM